MVRRRVGWLIACAGLAVAGLTPRSPGPETIAPGVTVAGVAVGGMTPSQARQTLASDAAAANPAVTLTGVGTWRISARALGLSLDAQSSADRALQVGRRGTRLRRCVEAACMRQLPATWTLDEAQAAVGLRGLARAVNVAPAPARWTGGAGCGLQMPLPGRELDVKTTLAQLRSAATAGLTRPVPMAVVAPASPATAEVVQGARERLAEVSLPLPGGPRSANLRAALRCLDGSVIRAGGWLSLLGAIIPISPARGFVFATDRRGRACLGGGLEAAQAAVERAARQADLRTVREPMPPALSAALPLAEDLLIGNTMWADALIVCEAEDLAASIRIMGRRAPGADPDPAARPAPPGGITLAFAGDVLPAGPVRDPGGLGKLMRGCDLSLANLECPISRRGRPQPAKLGPGEWAFRAAPEQARLCLRGWGLDILSLANNHTLDYGPEALADTVRVAAGEGAVCAGAGESAERAWAPAVVDRGGLRVGVLCCVGSDTLPPGAEFAAGPKRPGAAVLDTSPAGIKTACAKLARHVADLRWRADVVIVSLHAGREASGAPTAAQRQLAQAAAEAGADLVFGHHPHRLQPLAMVGGCLVAYSLGNFVFPPARPMQGHSGALIVWWGEEGLQGAGFVPAVIEGRTPRPVTDPDTMQEIARELIAPGAG
ncbi:MAG TPA: CapA family protein [Armatimonadota bacterium]|nr:CapA family protein [Armatimonadota bacterium]